MRTRIALRQSSSGRTTELTNVKVATLAPESSTVAQKVFAASGLDRVRRQERRCAMNYVIEPDPAYPGEWMIGDSDADNENYEVVRRIETFSEAQDILCLLLAGVSLRDYDEALKRGVQ
jgi:hypothetical protein